MKLIKKLQSLPVFGKYTISRKSSMTAKQLNFQLHVDAMSIHIASETVTDAQWKRLLLDRARYEARWFNDVGDADDAVLAYLVHNQAVQILKEQRVF